MGAAAAGSQKHGLHLLHRWRGPAEPLHWRSRRTLSRQQGWNRDPSES